MCDAACAHTRRPRAVSAVGGQAACAASAASAVHPTSRPIHDVNGFVLDEANRCHPLQRLIPQGGLTAVKDSMVSLQTSVLAKLEDGSSHKS